jgi:HK97 family phage major capsid protein
MDIKTRLNELTKAYDEKVTKAATLADQVKAATSDGVDLKTLDFLSGETATERIASLKSVIKELDDFNSEAAKAELGKLADEITELKGLVDYVVEAPNHKASSAIAGKTDKANVFKAFREGQAVELFADNLKNAFVSVVDVVGTDGDPSTVKLVSEQSNAQKLLASFAGTGKSVQPLATITKITKVKVNRGTTEGGDYVELETQFEQATSRAGKATAITKVSDEALADIAGFESTVNGLIVDATREDVLRMAFTGTGSGGDVVGLLNTIGTQSVTVAANANGSVLVDGISKAMSKLEEYGFNATRVYINSAQKSTIELAKDNNGAYLFSNAADGLLKNIRGVELFVSPAVPAGKIFVVDGSPANVQLNFVGGLELQSTNTANDDFQSGLHSLRGAARPRFDVFAPQAVAIVSVGA